VLQFERVLTLSGHEQWPQSLSFAVDGMFTSNSLMTMFCASLTVVRGVYCDRWCRDVVGWLEVGR